MSAKRFLLRGKNVQLDFILAPAYRIPLERLRSIADVNAERFLDGDRFKLDFAEADSIREMGIHIECPIWAYTRIGVLILSMYVPTPIAIKVGKMFLKELLENQGVSLGMVLKFEWDEVPKFILEPEVFDTITNEIVNGNDSKIDPCS